MHLEMSHLLRLPPGYSDVRVIALNRTGGDKANIHGIHNPENAILNKKNESCKFLEQSFLILYFQFSDFVI